MVEHYFSSDQSSPFTPTLVEIAVRNQTFTLYSASGVFSSRKLDKGTEILITYAHVASGWNILDLGCGYGVVGLSLLKAEPTLKVTFTDINQRAVELVKMNLQHLSLKGTVVCGDGYAAVKEKFDTILLNPPQTAGKKLCLRLISEAKQHLRPGGSLQMVARHKKGGASLSQHMEDTFGNLSVRAKKAGYWVYLSTL